MLGRETFVFASKIFSNSFLQPMEKLPGETHIKQMDKGLEEFLILQSAPEI
jgi:hypothetical protein